MRDQTGDSTTRDMTTASFMHKSLTPSLSQSNTLIPLNEKIILNNKKKIEETKQKFKE